MERVEQFKATQPQAEEFPGFSLALSAWCRLGAVLRGVSLCSVGRIACSTPAERAELGRGTKDHRDRSRARPSDHQGIERLHSSATCARLPCHL